MFGLQSYNFFFDYATFCVIFEISLIFLAYV